MRKSAIIGTAVAGAAALVVGGVVIGTQLGGDEPAASAPTETPAVEVVESPAPVETVEASPTPEVVETVGPEYGFSETEQLFIDWVRPGLEFRGLDATDQEIADAIAPVCDGETEPFPDASSDANQVYVDGIRNGYFIDGEQMSYCP